jgi:AcrR family transcriptional regulator
MHPQHPLHPLHDPEREDPMTAGRRAAAPTVTGTTDTSCAPFGDEPHHRRRGPTLTAAIFAAVLDQMGKSGFSAMTMEGVASCAHTGKAALYRRWRSKTDLVVDALNHVLPDIAEVPDHGNLRDDLVDALRRMFTLVNSEPGRALLALMTHAKREPALADAINARVIAPRKAVLMEVLRRAAERGEIAPEAVDPLIADVGPALIAHRLLRDGPPLKRSVVDEVVDKVVLPLARQYSAAG